MIPNPCPADRKSAERDVTTKPRMAMICRTGFLSAAACLLGLLTNASPVHANVAPAITGTPARSVYAGFTYRFAPTARDRDGDALRFSISNKPAWATFDPATGRLRGTPQRSGLFSNIVIRVSDGSATRALPAFSIRVLWNHPPRIWGTPQTRTAVGSWYSFQPTAHDRDGQPLTFGIRGKPAWASFSIFTGKLSGRPPRGSAGTYSDIRLRVTDGDRTAWLPSFSLTVGSGGGGTINLPPTIAGTAAPSAPVGQHYAFTPTAADPNNDTLSFNVSGKPAWARFDASKGTLYGLPTAGDIGVFNNIVISVTDGKATASLAPFSITVANAVARSVTLNWTAPTRNTDGSALTNLAGYKIYYGKVSRQYSNVVTVQGAGATSYAVTGLTAGAWYFAIRSVDVMGVMSNYSGEVRVVL